jgi:hypothetical protein
MNPHDPAADHDLLVRIDERTKGLCQSFEALTKTVVTQKEFIPVKNITYGLVGLLLTTVILAIIASVLR